MEEALDLSSDRILNNKLLLAEDGVRLPKHVGEKIVCSIRICILYYSYFVFNYMILYIKQDELLHLEFKWLTCCPL